MPQKKKKRNYLFHECALLFSVVNKEHKDELSQWSVGKMKRNTRLLMP